MPNANKSNLIRSSAQASAEAMLEVENPQTWGRVFAAEFRRIILRPAVLISMGVFVLATLGVTIGGMAVMEWAAQSGAGVGSSGFTGFGLPVSLISFAMSLLCVSATSRDYSDGAAAASLVVVPRRGRLVTARMAVWAGTTFVVSLVAFLLVMVVQIPRIDNVTQTIASALCSSMACVVLVMVGFACATVFRRGAFSMLVFLGLDLIIPSGISLGSAFAPGALADILGFVAKVMPGRAVETFADVSTLHSAASGDWVFGAVASVAWLVAAIVMSSVAFSRYAGASD